MNRQQALAELRRGQPFDLLVVGGGIAGAGVVLEAARAGARVALVEARDFASGTSSRSSKLVHGGLRYIAQGQFGLTRESVQARDALLREAPGLVRALRFVLPVRTGDKNGRARLGLGLALYDALARQHTRRWHGAAELQGLVPGLADGGLRGGWSYLDAQTDDARLVLRVLAEAGRHGALCLNYQRVTAITRRGGAVEAVQLQDEAGGLPFDVPARCIVNATGAWADGLRDQRAPALRPLRGSHLLLADWRLPLAQAVAFAHPADGRPVFALPWEGATLVGTTDLDHADDLAREPCISAAEGAYLLQAVQQAFPALQIDARDVVSTWSGVRPVVASGRDVDPSREPREHLVVDEQGLITVTGGKLTTFRTTALQALALAARYVPSLGRMQGGASGAANLFARPADSLEVALADVPAPLRARWLGRFGPDAAGLQVAVDGEALDPIAHTEVTQAELRHACRNEAVLHLDDLLLRRTRLGLLLRDGAAAWLPALRGLVQHELDWDDAHWHGEVERYQALVARCHRLPGEAGRTGREP